MRAQWMCLSSKGNLCHLGEHETFDEAEDAAMRFGIEAIWIIDQDTASEWRAKLDRWLGDDGYSAKYGDKEELK